MMILCKVFNKTLVKKQKTSIKINYRCLEPRASSSVEEKLYSLCLKLSFVGTTVITTDEGGEEFRISVSEVLAAPTMERVVW